MQWGERPCDGVAQPGKCAACVLDARGVPRAVARAIGNVPNRLARCAARVAGPVGTAIGMSDVIRHNIERERELLATADHFVVLTDGARQILHANGIGNGNVLVNRLGVGVPVERRVDSRRAAGRSISIGYVGRFDVIKGVEVLARAVTLLEPDIPLVVEFRGPVQSTAERAVRKRVETIAAGDRRVRFAEPVPHDQIGEVLRGYARALLSRDLFRRRSNRRARGAGGRHSRRWQPHRRPCEIVEDGVNGRLGRRTTR